MAGTFAVGGLISGLNWYDVIDQLMNIEHRRVDLLEDKKSDYQTELSAWGTVNSKLSDLFSKVQTLNSLSTMGAMRASSSDEEILTATATSSASIGSFSIIVSALAQAHKIASDEKTSLSAALGYSGEILINGKAVGIETTDTLSDLKGKINNADAGVKATILKISDESYRLILTREETGSTEISLADVNGGNLLEDLGLADSSDSSQDNSLWFADTTSAVQSLIGSSASFTSQTVTINGTDVSIDLSQDSLQDIKDKLVAAGIAASIESDTNRDDNTIYRIVITGGISSYTDSANTLEVLGFVKPGVKNQLEAAQDASLTVDGLSITRSTNTITDLIEGVTLELKVTSTDAVTLTVSQDIDVRKEAIEDFVGSYNDLMSYIREQFSYDPETDTEAKPLIGDSTLRYVEEMIRGTIISQVSGLSSSLNALARIGITTNYNTGELEIDDSILDEYLANNPQDIINLFTATATTTDPDVTYMTHTDNTAVGTYGITITQLAEKAWVEGDYVVDSGGISQDETLTFTIDGSTEVVVNLTTGDEIDDIVNKINSEMTAQGVEVTASNEGGKLRITHDYYGSSHSVEVISDRASSTTSSGIGTTPKSDAGQDVAGSFTQGEETYNATGSGLYLTGSEGGANGLMVKISSDTTGDQGEINLIFGIAEQLEKRLSSWTSSTDGLISTREDGLQETIDDLDERIADMEAQLELKRKQLETQFTRMEILLNQLKATSDWLTQQVAAWYE